MNRREFLSLQARPAAASLERYDGPWDAVRVAHLLRRAVGSPSVAELRAASAMSMDALVDAILTAPASLPSPSGWLGDVVNAQGFPWYDRRFDLNTEYFVELRRWWYAQLVNGGLSARERLTLFWHNHFASNGNLFDDPRLLYHQNQLLRRHALGSFRDLVRAVTVDKAMLIFLDGKHNKAATVNENYARELQELFTVGVADNDGAPTYSQSDIIEAAKALTGWDWIGFGTSGDVMSNPLTGHDSSTKQVYGQTIAGALDGAPELERLLDILFAHEATARYVVRKLYRFFAHTDVPLTPVHPIAEEIETNIIAPLAETFRSSNWSIAAVLRRLFTSRHFYEEDIVGSAIRSPVDFYVGILRSTMTAPMTGDAGDRFFDVAQRRAKTLGMDLFFPPGVQGWQFHRSWISTTTLPQRHAWADELLGGVGVRLRRRANALFPDMVETRDGTARIDVLAFARQFASFDDAPALVADIARHMLAYPASPRLLARLELELVGDRAYEWADAPDDVRLVRLRAMLRALFRSSNFQLT